MIKFRKFFLRKSVFTSKLCLKKKALKALTMFAQYPFIKAKDTVLKAKGSATYEVLNLLGKPFAEIPKELKITIKTEK
jgi:hypothetical protein